MSSPRAETFYFGERTGLPLYRQTTSAETADTRATTHRSVVTGPVRFAVTQLHSTLQQPARQLIPNSSSLFQSPRRFLSPFYPSYPSSHQPFARTTTKKPANQEFRRLTTQRANNQVAKRTTPLPPLPNRIQTNQQLELLKQFGTICNRRLFIQQALLLLQDAVLLSTASNLHSAEVVALVLETPVPLNPKHRKVVKQRTFQVKITIKGKLISFYHILSPWHARFLTALPSFR